MIKNKKIIAAISFLIFFIIVMFVSYLYMNTKYLSENEIKSIVFFHSASNEIDVNDYSFKKEVSESGKLIFKVNYSDSKGVYSFILNGENGEIIEYSKLNHGESVPEIFESSKQVSK